MTPSVVSMHSIRRLVSSSAQVSGTVLWDAACSRASRISFLISVEGKRTPILMVHKSGMVFSPMPPVILPQLMSLPREMSLQASSATIL